MATLSPGQPAAAGRRVPEGRPAAAGSPPPAAPVLAQEVGALVEGVFAAVTVLRDAVRQVLGAGPAATADLAVLDAPVQALLRDPGGLVVGAGYVAAPAVLDDAPYWLQWWTVDAPGGAPAVLVVETDERAEGFRDYTALPWYAVPAATGARHVTGPYVDYLCTDEYSLTFTMPVVTGRGFAGVVGADVYVRHLERLLVARMREAARSEGGRVALVNAQGRVVCGSSPDLVTGGLVRDAPLGGLWPRTASTPAPPVPAPAVPGVRLHPCPGAPLGVLVRTD